MTAEVSGVAIAAREYLASGETEASQASEVEYGDPDKKFTLNATAGEIEVAPGKTVETWLYNEALVKPPIQPSKLAGL